MPFAHILMPIYNVDKFILASIQSVLNQNYPNWKLLIFNDGSTDNTLKKIQELLEKKPELKEQIYLQSDSKNHGVSSTRTKLIEWSKNLNQNAYIFWLDADDQYTDFSFIQNVIQKMQATNADICILNFSTIYEDKKQEVNAFGLLKEKDKTKEIIQEILTSPNQSVNAMTFPKILEITSLGCAKCYGPNIVFPKPLECPFQDFVYMSALLEAKAITALPAEYEPAQYLCRADSIRGQRKSKHFTDDIPNQLRKFFDTVLENSQGTEQLQKLTMAQGFVVRKLDQYLDTLEKIVKTKSHQGIDQNVLDVYRTKMTHLKNYMQNQR